jgi:mannose-6-phosphate isomerase
MPGFVPEQQMDTVARLARALADRPRVLPLVGRLQRYAWGGTEFLRDLTGLGTADDGPVAEWWLGAHPSAPSRVQLGGDECPLDALIARAPALTLGPRVVERFGPRLPFLVKVLDVREMLSIQAHPTRAQARAGFAREDAAGVPLDAPERTYRDDNHKPEAQVALTPLWLLSGFRPLGEMAAVLGGRPELVPLASRVDAWSRRAQASGDAAPVVRRVFEHVMTMEQEQVDALLSPLARRLVGQYGAGQLARSSPDFWAARAARPFVDSGAAFDRGIISCYLLNLACLAPGQATFLGPGLLHAYLEGTALEIMASSDNVVRGGLTPKHIDVPELLRIVTFEPGSPHPRGGEPHGPHEQAYAMPVDDFELRRWQLPRPGHVESAAATGPEVLVALEGSGVVRCDGGDLRLPRGAAAFVPAATRYTVAASEGPYTVFRARVPNDA